MTLIRPLRLALLLPLVAGNAMSAAAMNWEGHDEQLKDVPGIEAFSAGAEHKPLPSPPCPLSWEQVKANPYEQIPLKAQGCTPPPSEKLPTTK